MQITPNITNRIAGYVRSYEQLTAQFLDFASKAKCLEEAGCPIRGVVVTGSEDKMSFEVAFTGIRITLHYVPMLLAGSHAPRGRVVCTLDQPSTTGDMFEVGSFTFDRDGTTDIAFPSAFGTVELVASGLEIVTQLLEDALKHLAPPT
jgi:hypothetical protein